MRSSAIAFTILSLYWSVFFWQEVFGGLDRRRCGTEGPSARVLLSLLALFRARSDPARPHHARSARSTRKVQGVVDEAIRFRLQTQWRVEAAELIDALPMFDDLPEDVLSDLAGRVQPAARSRPASRSSDRGIDPTPSTSSGRASSTCSRRTWRPGRSGCSAPSAVGESFGELGLIDGARTDRDRSRRRGRAAVRGRRKHVRPAPVGHGARARVRANASSRPPSSARSRPSPRSARATLAELLEHGAVGERRARGRRHRAG